MTDVRLEGVYIPSENVVAREIEGEVIIVPLVRGIGEEDELFSLNDTGKVIWRYLDGNHTLAQIITTLTDEFEAEPGEIEQDVLGLSDVLVKRGILVEA